MEALWVVVSRRSDHLAMQEWQRSSSDAEYYFLFVPFCFAIGRSRAVEGKGPDSGRSELIVDY